ncbi:hypothetical protein [Microbacterium sp.]|uniref:hypothetical protein n=1 Tax=Microbacterium sp. TaxID=51671 RepID=UPI0039E50C82
MGNMVATALSSSPDARAGDILRLRREISRMQRRRAEHRLLPLDPALSSLLPDSGLVAGTAYTISPSPALTLALLSAASRQGHWCAVVGMPTLGIEAAAAFGIDLARLVLVPEPGPRWLSATSALAEVVPLIAVAPPARARDADLSRLNSRLRDRGTTLLVAESAAFDSWPESQGSIRLSDPHWHGLGEGWGLLSGCTATVTAQTRRDPRPARVRVALPSDRGGVEAVTPAETGALTALPRRVDSLAAAG